MSLNLMNDTPEPGNMTSLAIDIEFLELLSSKICHDLISPIGAINNGLEILEEMDAESSGEVIDLIAFSAQQASAKLQAFRMAYGIGGADSHIKPEDVYNAIEAIVGAEKKITQEWNPHEDISLSDLPNGYCKILIAMILLAMDCLPKGGKLSVSTEENGTTCIRAEGENAGLRDGNEPALNLSTDTSQLEPANVHAYMTGLLIKNYNMKAFTGSDSQGNVDLRFNLQAVI